MSAQQQAISNSRARIENLKKDIWAIPVDLQDTNLKQLQLLLRRNVPSRSQKEKSSATERKSTLPLTYLNSSVWICTTVVLLLVFIQIQLCLQAQIWIIFQRTLKISKTLGLSVNHFIYTHTQTSRSVRKWTLVAFTIKLYVWFLLNVFPLYDNFHLKI